MGTSTEKWSKVTGYEKLYDVSDQGRVKSLLRKCARAGNTTRVVPELILSIIIQSRGYPVVTLCKYGVQKRKRVSRLVAIEFVPNPDNLPEVNHDDGDKTNCRATNLTWEDRSGNMKHAYRTGLRSKPLGYTKAMGHV